MKKNVVGFILVLFSICCMLAASAAAQDAEPERITAEQAFDAVQTQKDPLTGEAKTIALVDVRSRAEFFWVGTACQVDEIILKDGKTCAPDLGKAVLIWEGLFLKFKVHNRPRIIPTGTVEEVKLSPIAMNIPFKLWDEDTASMVLNENFGTEIENLAAEQDVDIIIFFCRSGGRSQDCLNFMNPSLFEKIYEIDQPDLTNGLGGFEGTSYSNVYLGYRGFPQRKTMIQEHFSVSWKDTGLPMKTGVNPF